MGWLRFRVTPQHPFQIDPRGTAIASLDHHEVYQEALEAELREVFSSRQGFLYDLLRYHLGWTDQQGLPVDNPRTLYFPPMLALLSCEALSGDFRPALPVAAGVELVYNFTLVHGDVQAGRPEAQDRPSIWWVWGPAQAINAGDGLHALGRTTIMRLAQSGVAPDRVLRAVECLDRACLSLCEGQYMDLEFQDRLMVTSAAYFDMISRKIGALTGCSAESGALAARADDSACARFLEMGSKMGMAWQVSRDVADLWGNEGDSMSASSVLNKKKSFPIIHALENSDVATKRELGAIYMHRVLQPEDVSKLVEILDQVDARRFALEKAQELLDQAMEAVEGIGLSNEGVEGLRRLGQRALEGNI